MISRKLSASLSVAALAVSGSVAFAGTAGAATAPLNVTTSACGTGSSAGLDYATDNVMLTVGTANAATCGAPAGSTYDPAYAKMTVNGISGIATPAAEPSFTTDNYNSGSPRWVVDLNNGHSLWGYPANSGLNGSDMAWAVDNGNTYTSYSTAFSSANAGTTTVKDAYIVEDADQSSGTTDTLSAIQFNGQTIHSATTGPGMIRNTGSGKCLDVTAGVFASGTKLQQWTCGAKNPAGVPGGDQQFSLVGTTANGQTYGNLQTTGPDGNVFYVVSNGLRGQLTLSSSPAPVSKTGPYYQFIQQGTSGNLAMDVKGASTLNGAAVIGYLLNRGTNQQWSLP